MGLKTRYEVVFHTHDGLPSSYKGVVMAPFREDGFLELVLPERRVYVNLNDVVSYSVRVIEEGEQKKEPKKLPIKYDPRNPGVLIPADDFPGPETGGGESA